MDTGEGKTLVGALAAAIQSLAGRHVHILSVNDYLAERDANWMRPMYDMLDIKSAWIGQHTTAKARKKFYTADVVYAPVTEIGYDVLRDSFAVDVSEQVLPRFDVGIVDEADAVMIDEAMSPLVLAGESEGFGTDFEDVTALVSSLEPGQHFVVDADRSAVSLTEPGIDVVEDQLGGINLYDAQHIDELTRINLALQARALVHRDIDYLVENGTIRLVNTSRGRISHLHRWPDGLHAAIEAKEGLPVSTPGMVLDSLTIQDLLLRYESLAGMSGTILAVSEELQEFYYTESGRIESHKPRIRNDKPLRVFFTHEEKEHCIINEITARHTRGQPVLVGTQSVAESELYARMLDDAAIPVQVLNARNPVEEAAIISEAGQYGAVTISTQMSGRGTDIKLGGPAEHDRQRVVSLGGLAVLSTSMYPSRRLDAQLLGRSGRQGDPGVTLQFASLDDELVSAYMPSFMRRKLQQRGRQLATQDLVDIAQSAQKVAEATRLERHRSTWQYSRAIALQHETVLEQRSKLLENVESVAEIVQDQIPDAAAMLVSRLGSSGYRSLLRTLALQVFDDAWTQHLALLNDVREGINLRVLAGQDPVQQFHLIALREFDGFLENVHQEVCDLVVCAAQSDQPPSGESLGLRRPSATWTYMVPENPLGTPSDRAARNVQRIARTLFRRG